MPPKKSTTAAPKKAASAKSAEHGSYQDMIKDAIIQLKEKGGSSRQTLKKYVKANNNLGNVSDNSFNTLFNKALSKGSESGLFDRPKGSSGTVKLGKPTAKPKAESPVADKKPVAKTAAKPKAAPATKKTASKAAPKKAAATTKKAPVAKSATKKAPAAKPKANTSKTRKTPTAAPAVEDTKPTVLGKTKSGRVTKTTAPQPAKKAAAPKKKAPATKKGKTATPKKAAA